MNKWEAEAREKKARAIANALVAEANQRGKNVADTVLPIVETFARGENSEERAKSGRYLITNHGIKSPPSVITWERVRVLLTEKYVEDARATA